MSGTFYILSVDGGGFRGLFAAHLLRRIEEEWQLDWSDRFGLLAGTSTGSILTAGLACGLSAVRLSKFYDRYGEEIFAPRLRSRFDVFNLFTSRYGNAALRVRLEETFGKTTLREVAVPLILPAVNIGEGCVHVFKSKFHDAFLRDPGVRVADAVLASCAAPTYFDPHIVHDYQVVDGGLWANNPSLVAVIDAHYRLHIPLEDIRVLSIGTGTSRSFYPRSGGRWRDRLVHSWQGWGIATRWQRSKLLDLILNLQSANAHNMLCLLLRESPLDPNRVLRLTFESDQPLPMDSTCMRDDLVAKADHAFTHNATKIGDFLSLPGDTR